MDFSNSSANILVERLLGGVLRGGEDESEEQGEPIPRQRITRGSTRKVKRIWGPRVGEESKEARTKAQSRDWRRGEGVTGSKKGKKERERKKEKTELQNAD